MGILVQIRDVPEDVHHTLKARAAQAGLSLSEFLRAELERTAAAPTPDELLVRLGARKSLKPRQSSAEVLRALRDKRG